MVAAPLPERAMLAPAGAKATAAFGNGVSFPARKSWPTGSPAAPVAGEMDEATSKVSVAAASRTMLPPPNVTEPLAFIVALANGMPANPATEENEAPSSDASIQSVPAFRATLAEVGAGSPRGVIT